MMKLEDYLETTSVEKPARLNNAEAAHLLRFLLARKFRKIRRSLKRHPRFLIAGLALAVLLCILTLRLLFGPVSAAPGARNRPVYEPLVNGKKVTLEIIHLNGQSAPPEPMKKALAFSRHTWPANSKSLMSRR